MKISCNILAGLSLLWMMAAAPAFAAASSNPHLGTWKLNEAKSKFSAGAAKNTTVTYSDAGNGMTKLECGGVDKDGKNVHWTWEGKFDGKQYKVTGSPYVDTLSCKEMDAYTNTNTGMKDDKVASSSVVKVARDGKSRTVTTTRTDVSGKKVTDMAYYDKS